MNEDEIERDEKGAWVAACVAIAATYVYFLIFAQFGLLALAKEHGVTSDLLQQLMGAMGGGGILGAVAAAWLFSATRCWAQLLVLFVACALAAQVAMVAASTMMWLIAFGFVGLSLGGLTVTLAAMLNRAVAGRRLGLCIGLGTGVAYALCNLPPVFTAEPEMQAWIAVAAAAVGVAATTRLHLQEMPESPRPKRGALIGWLGALTALVWMDSAVFYVIQQTPTLRAQTWEGDLALLANAAVHLVAGVASGMALDAGWKRLPALAAIGLLAIASLMLAGLIPVFAPGWLYVAGVSFYSVVLVYKPAVTGRASVSAAVFAVAGWAGSALGIGMAQDLSRVPVWFVAVAVAVVLGALWPRRWAAWGVAAVALGGSVNGEAADAFVERGREVYIREGCIHCHSQYVRPHSPLDIERWGPATDLEKLMAEKPPLPGNRRQGPDLAHVGNRRSLTWNRLHLQIPRQVSPGSRMPSYAHLFMGNAGDTDGDALVAYLASLGVDTISDRWAQVADWRPSDEPAIDDKEAKRLFAKLCVNCHGSAGRGDGVLASRLSVRPPDWAAGGWRKIAADEQDVNLALARLIKFGVLGSPMAGHEYLSDAEVQGLARVVRGWQKQ